MVVRPGQCLVWSEISCGSATWSVSCLVSSYLSWKRHLVSVLSGRRSLVVVRPGQCLVWSEISRGSATWSVSCLVGDLSW